MDPNVGRGWAFPPRIGNRSRMSMVEDDADIRRSMHVILNTFPGERVMRPDFGCDIHTLIFWPANDETCAVAERLVKEALGRWEPRVNIQSVTATPANTERGEIVIEVVYEVKDRHDVRSLVYPFYLIPG